jgi:predicted  nucleic acid-binding Zn-ribbon protein
MEAITEFPSLKTQLEQKAVDLENERDAIQREIASLNEKLAVKELEVRNRSLEGQVNALRDHKSSLEERLASFDSPQVIDAPSN